MLEAVVMVLLLVFLEHLSLMLVAVAAVQQIMEIPAIKVLVVLAAAELAESQSQIVVWQPVEPPILAVAAGLEHHQAVMELMALLAAQAS
jgi:hypothetical protein